MLNWLKKLTLGQEKQKQESAEQVRQWMKDGFAYFQSGNQEAAQELFESILREQPDNADALYLLGVIENNKGRNKEAAELISRAIIRDGGVASYHLTLANVLRALGRGKEALASYRKAVALDPDDAQLQNDFSCALHSSGEFNEALEHLYCALRLAPNNAQTHYNLGVTLQFLDRDDEAAKSYSNALSLDPGHDQAGNSLGVIFYTQRRLAEAIACFRRTLDRWPEHAQAWCNLGVALQASQRAGEAESCLLRAISLNPQNFIAHSNLALALREQGRLEESMASSEHALAIRDSFSERIRQATLLPVVARSADEIRAWRRHFDVAVSELLARGGRVDDPLHEIGACNFNLAYQPECDIDLQEKAARLYSTACPTLLYVAPHCRRRPQPAGGRIRVGFISKFMHDHSIGRTTRGLLANVARDRFHVTALFVPPLVEDFISHFIRKSADDYLVLPGTLEGAREKIAELELDILFYQDIGMDAYTYFLAFSRLAPVQCVSFGHPDTTGIPNMDYWVSSENFELEGAAAQYSEQLFLLRNLGTLAYYYRPAIEQPQKTRQYFGLPQDMHVYVCPQALFKVHPDFDAFLANILRSDPLGEVVLVDARTAAWGQLLRERFQKTLPDVVGRVRFVPAMSREDFLALIAVCDVMLDTIYFNGMNTSLEALAVGIPVVTLPTLLQRGRHTYGMYKRMGMDECIARTPEQYINISLRLGTDKNFRDEVKAKILSSCAVLFEDIEVVREFERFFVEAHTHSRAAKREMAVENGEAD